jgi:hypothetical protein
VAAANSCPCLPPRHRILRRAAGSWPGQPWLWLYTMWYQVPPMNSSANADVLVLAIMAVLSLALLVLPFIPGLRSIPRLIPVHRIIWRRYYKEHGA